TRVLRLLMEGTRCVGVEVDGPGGRREVRAGEVIVSAGAIHSPAMLLRAGIGPADHLAKHGIPVTASRDGVGNHLLDHPMISVSAFMKRPARLAASQRRHIFLGMRWSSGIEDCPPTDMY